MVPDFKGKSLEVNCEVIVWSRLIRSTGNSKGCNEYNSEKRFDLCFSFFEFIKESFKISSFYKGFFTSPEKPYTDQFLEGQIMSYPHSCHFIVKYKLVGRQDSPNCS